MLLSIIRKNLDERQQLRAAEKRLTEAKARCFSPDTNAWIHHHLMHENWQIRNVAVKLAGEGRYEEFVGVLSGFIVDGSQKGFIRRNSATALAGFGSVNEDVLSSFFSGLDDPYWEVRTECAIGISRHGHPDEAATMMLINRIFRKSPETIIRYPVIWPKRIYREKNFEVRAAMFRALGAVMHHVGLIHALEIPLEEDIWKVREAAMTAFVAAAARLRYPEDRFIGALKGMDLTCTEFIPIFPIRRTAAQLSSAKPHASDEVSDHAV